MAVFYDVFMELCRQKGVKPGRVATDIGINRANVTFWKQTGNPPKADILAKLAEYFSVSVDTLLGTSEPERPSDAALKFALFGGDADQISDAAYDEVKRFAAYVAQREKEKKG